MTSRRPRRSRQAAVALSLGLALVASGGAAAASAPEGADHPRSPRTSQPRDLPERVLVGYHHTTFANGSGYMRLADVPDEWDVVNLSFGESSGDGVIDFERCSQEECPDRETDEEFKAAVADLQAAGKTVQLSIGGANGTVQLTSPAARDNFVSSVGGIVDEYGLDGVDVDFEGSSLYLDEGDRDFREPTTPVITHLIEALQTLAGSSEGFTLTMAPETFFVQVGYEFYGSGQHGGADPRAGAYLPVIHALRDELTLLHVQHYNSGPIKALDDVYYTMGEADFHAAMADMVLSGFPVEGDADRFFEPLRPDQVAFGLPASQEAGNGFTPVAQVHSALDCLIKGSGCGRYQPQGTHPDLRGLMSWSINWDAFNGFEFSSEHRAYLDSLS
ncbi:MAG: chitinase [Stackebrandtia sp.]